MLRRDVGVGVAFLEERRRDPGHVDARQLDAIFDDEPALRGNDRRLHLHWRNGRSALQRAEVFLDELLGRGLVDVAGDRNRRVVRRVVLPEKFPHVVELRGLDVGVRSDDDAVVRMPFGKQRLEHRFLDDAVRPVLGALPPLVPHDVLLVRQLGLIDRLEQVSHAIGLEPERELELIGRHRLEVVGAIEIRSCR